MLLSGKNKLYSTPWKVLVLMTGLSLVIRFFSFFPSVMDHDESTYILIADALRHGQVYLRDVVDTKPIGIFILFASFQIVFGKSIFIIRIITAIWIAFTAWMIYLTHRKLLAMDSRPETNPAPFASGIIYIFITSLFIFYGLSPNTEHFFNLFTISALFLILQFRQVSWFFLAGLLLGYGFIIKYVVLFDAIALGLFYVWLSLNSEKKWHYWLVRCMLMGFGFCLPFVFTILYYNHMGLEKTFYFYSFELSGRYLIKPVWYEYVWFIAHSFISFIPVVIWFLYCLIDWKRTGPTIPILGSLWGALVIIIMLLPGRLFPHYFIQFMLPMSLVAGSFFDSRRHPGRFLSWMRNPAIGYPFLILLFLLTTIFQKIKFYDRTDYSREVAIYLNAKLEPGDILYTGDYNQIIYLLTDQQSPTRYIHPSLIWNIGNSYALNIDGAAEMEKILDQKPRFILIRYPLLTNNPIYEELHSSYNMVQIFDKEVMIYERI